MSRLIPSETMMKNDGYTKVTDSSTYRILIKTRAQGFSNVSNVFCFVPGNPGVATAYIPWLNHMASILGDGALIVFSGHLGHLQEADEVRDFTCEENVLHQLNKLREIYRQVEKHNKSNFANIKFHFCGHSAGAYFVLHATKRLLKEVAFDEVRPQISLIFYCGTVVEFGSIGKFKALIAASSGGVSLMRKIMSSNWMTNRMQQDQFIAEMAAEFTETFLGNMSTLTRDELKELPRNRQKEIESIRKLNIPTYFLFASNDAYVPKSLQNLILNTFGPTNVFIGHDWWHAFCLHSVSFHECSELTEAIIKDGMIPEERQTKPLTSSVKWAGYMFDLRSIIAAMIVTIWTLPSAVLPTRIKKSGP
eukprot:Gregarina_sp_Poly_1__11246@NODE_929_length_5674_cov_208_795256_g660_i0_p2_GENE_NODE_929_length_5674_cov_208_795256_g660_i0NODE_929_length_5674_cov_208_795256_g660_i0_p2_ORF_typecomplete_len363_score42_19LIDHydrolase/PF10230_9/1_7e24Abhydrolase_6/PF12697_7/2_1e05Hydrolase_4/PF12146_8/4_6e05Ser_hydrolase/PF06821_13/8_9e02Ser_hydrolase/PF06821_13/7_1Ser_hydrolase/PF06821_13/0_26Abhydrolase_3/PF07859_13/0_00067DUF1057/PF06342_12/0_0023FSH1/PF03959_13/0_003Thioesterase/PF00975_20/0_013DUF900/PF05990_